MSEHLAAPYLVDEYIYNDNERANAYNGPYPVVYDCIDPSPFYDPSDPEDIYIDEKDLIELPPVNMTSEGVINEPY